MRLTAREYEELKALARQELLGNDRRDFGVAIAAYVTAGSMGWKGDIKDLLPVRMKEKEQTDEDIVAVLKKLSHGPKHSNPSS